MTYLDIRSVMDWPAATAARMCRGAAMLNLAIAAAARDGEDPLTNVLRWSLRTASRARPVSDDVACAETSSQEHPATRARTLRDLGGNVDAVANTLTKVVRDSWAYEEKPVWEWLFLERPSSLGGYSPIEALQAGQGDAVLGLLDNMTDAVIARMRRPEIVDAPP